MTNPVDISTSSFSSPRAPAQKRGASSQDGSDLASPLKIRRVVSGTSSSPLRRPLTQTSQQTSPSSLLLDTPPRSITSSSSSLLTSPATQLASQLSGTVLNSPPQPPKSSVAFMRERWARKALLNHPSLDPPPAAIKARSLLEEGGATSHDQEPVPSSEMQVDVELRMVDDCLEKAKIIRTNFARYAPKSDVAKLDAFLASISKETFPKFQEFIREVFTHVDQKTDLKKLAEMAKKFVSDERNKFSTIIFDLLNEGEPSICLSLLYALMEKMDPQFQLSENSRQIINKSESSSWSHLFHAKPNQIIGQILDSFELRYAQAKDSHDEKRIMKAMIDSELNPILLEMVDKLDIVSLNECFETIKKHILYLPDVDNLCLEEREPLLKMALRALKSGKEARPEPFFLLQANEFRSIFVLNHHHLTHPELNGQIPQGLHLWPSSRDATAFQFESDGLLGVATRREPMIGAGPVTFAPYTVDAAVSGPGARAVHGNKISSFFPHYMDLKELARGVSQIIHNPLNDVKACTTNFTEQYFGKFNDPKGDVIHAMLYIRTNSREDGTKVDPDGVRQICSAFPVITRSAEANPFPLRLSRTVKSLCGTEHQLINGSPLKVNQNTPTKSLKEAIDKMISPIRKSKRKFREDLERKIGAFFADKNNPFKLFPSNDPNKYILSAPLKVCTKQTLQESMIRSIPLVGKDGAVMKSQEIESAFASIRSPDVDAFWIMDREEFYQMVEEIVPKINR